MVFFVLFLALETGGMRLDVGRDGSHGATRLQGSPTIQRSAKSGARTRPRHWPIRDFSIHVVRPEFPLLSAQPTFCDFGVKTVKCFLQIPGTIMYVIIIVQGACRRVRPRGHGPRTWNLKEQRNGAWLKDIGQRGLTPGPSPPSHAPVINGSQSPSPFFVFIFILIQFIFSRFYWEVFALWRNTLRLKRVLIVQYRILIIFCATLDVVCWIQLSEQMGTKWRRKNKTFSQQISSNLPIFLKKLFKSEFNHCTLFHGSRRFRSDSVQRKKQFRHKGGKWKIFEKKKFFKKNFQRKKD